MRSFENMPLLRRLLDSEPGGSQLSLPPSECRSARPDEADWPGEMSTHVVAPLRAVRPTGKKREEGHRVAYRQPPRPRSVSVRSLDHKSRALWTFRVGIAG